jgi:hypothetical protein
VLIDFDPANPRRAAAESYGIAFHRSDGAEPSGNLITGFRFIDVFDRRDAGGWRIVRRVATTEWVRVERPEDRWPIPAGMRTGRRDGSDPVYSALG